MCNSDEHIDIGDTAQLGVPTFLVETGYGKGAGPASYTSFLSWWKDHNKSADDNECFTLHNGATVSYGDILAMTGDYYANFKDMDSVTKSTWDTKAKAEEIKMITSLYRKLGRNPAAHETAGKEPEQGDFFTHVALLATTNYPHFAPDAISWWLEWHRKAIDIAKAGRNAVQSGNLKSYTDNYLDKNDDNTSGRDPSVPLEWDTNSAAFVLADSLCRALKYNAFADHFLSDMWAAGHMRVMRRLHKTYFDTSFIDFSKILKELGRSKAGAVAAMNSATVQQLLSEMSDYPGIDLGDITSGMHHDEDGNRGLWYQLLLGDLTLPGLGIDDNDFSGKVGDVYALGDGTFYKKTANVASGGDSENKNVRNRKICYTAIRLSVRDVCLASALGSEFEGYKNSDAYWKVLGDVGAKPLYASLRLYPKPNAPDGKFVRSYNGREVSRSNHYPLVAPDGDVGKLDARYDAFKKMIMDGTPANVSEACWLRKIEPVKFDPVTIRGNTFQPPDLPVPGTGLTPRVSTTEAYWDIKAKWPDGSTPIDGLSDEQLHINYIPTETARKAARGEIRSAWRYMEIGRIVGEYVDLKFNPGQHYDCDA